MGVSRPIQAILHAWGPARRLCPALLAPLPSAFGVRRLQLLVPCMLLCIGPQSLWTEQPACFGAPRRGLSSALGPTCLPCQLRRRGRGLWLLQSLVHRGQVAGELLRA